MPRRRVTFGDDSLSVSFELVCLSRQEAREEVEAYRREHGAWKAKEDRLYAHNECRRAGRWYFEFEELLGSGRGGPYLSDAEAEEAARAYYLAINRPDPPRYRHPPHLDRGEEVEFELDTNEPDEDAAFEEFFTTLEAMAGENGRPVVQSNGSIEFQDGIRSLIQDVCYRITGVSSQYDDLALRNTRLSPRDQRRLVLAGEGEQSPVVPGSQEINRLRKRILHTGR